MPLQTCYKDVASCSETRVISLVRTMASLRWPHQNTHPRDTLGEHPHRLPLKTTMTDSRSYRSRMRAMVMPRYPGPNSPPGACDKLCLLPAQSLTPRAASVLEAENSRLRLCFRVPKMQTLAFFLRPRTTGLTRCFQALETEESFSELQKCSVSPENAALF